MARHVLKAMERHRLSISFVEVKLFDIRDLHKSEYIRDTIHLFYNNN